MYGVTTFSEKIAQIDAVNPEGISRRAAWNLHGRLVAALAKYHKSKVDSVYGKFGAIFESEAYKLKDSPTYFYELDDARALTQSTAQAVSTIRVGMRKA